MGFFYFLIYALPQAERMILMANHSQEERLFDLQLFAEADDDLAGDVGDIGGFDDDVILPEEPAEPEADDLAQDQQEPTTADADQNQETEPPEPYKLRVKFNHQEVEIPEPDAIPLIQKGMNYDKLAERLISIQNDPVFSKYDKVRQLADMYGVEDDALLDALYDQYYQTAADQQGLTPEQIRYEHELKQREATLNQRMQAEQQQRATYAMYDRFLQAFPNIKAEDIKPETWARVQSGMDLTTAYVLQQNQELSLQMQMLKQKEKNKQKAPVSGVTTHGSQDPAGEDDFLAGFNSDD